MPSTYERSEPRVLDLRKAHAWLRRDVNGMSESELRTTFLDTIAAARPDLAARAKVESFEWVRALYDELPYPPVTRTDAADEREVRVLQEGEFITAAGHICQCAPARRFDQPQERKQPMSTSRFDSRSPSEAKTPRRATRLDVDDDAIGALERIIQAAREGTLTRDLVFNGRQLLEGMLTTQLASAPGAPAKEDETPAEERIDTKLADDARARKAEKDKTRGLGKLTINRDDPPKNGAA